MRPKISGIACTSLRLGQVCNDDELSSLKLKEGASLPMLPSVADEADGLPTWVVFELSNTEQRCADSLVDVAEDSLATGPGFDVGDRNEVVLTIDRNELAR